MTAEKKVLVEGLGSSDFVRVEEEEVGSGDKGLLEPISDGATGV